MSTTVLIPPTVVKGSVSGGLAGSGNYYTFTVDTESIYTFKTTPIFTNGVSKGDADLNLYQFINGNAVLKAASDGITGQADVINVVLTPGDYQLETLPFIGTVEYNLEASYTEQLGQDYSDFGLSKSFSLGVIDWMSATNSGFATTALPEHQLAADRGTIIDFQGHKGDLHDAYSFTIDKPTTVTVSLTADAKSNVDLALYDDHNVQLKGSFKGVGLTDVITADLNPGTYWVDASFVSSTNSGFIANYDVSMSSSQYVLPVTHFRAFNGDATALAETFNYNNSAQPETITISNAQYSGLIDQAAVVNNFAGAVNAGILLTTGSAKAVLGHVYNEKQGLSTSAIETANNWSNTGDGTNSGGNGFDNVSMQPLTAAGNTAGYNANVFTAVNGLVTAENAVLDAAHQLAPITSVYDAASLSFDAAVSGKGNYLSFDLLFSSEEYALFADQYVDSAVIIVDGKNYALFNKADPKSILSVTQSNIDKGYFYSNTQLADGTSVYPTEFNGVSRLISVLAPINTSLATHHISIAIADTNDHVLDSAIFLTNLDSVDLTRVTDPIPTVSAREAGLAGLFATRAGTTANDVLSGTDGRDYSNLGAGNDKINTGAGDDVVSGGQGRDTIKGGDGNDAIQGGNSATDTVGDNLDGGAGNDVIAGDAGADTIAGGTGNDTVTAGSGNDSVSVGTGADSVDAGAGDDKVTAGKDTIGDNITAGTGNDSVASGAGNDTISVGTGADSVDSGAGNDIIQAGTDTVGDVIEAGTGNDTVIGGGGNDIICGDLGVDNLTGGLGSDLFEFCTAQSGSVDTITDFSPVDDTIQLDRSAFISFTVTGTLAIGSLVIGTKAVDFNDYLIYNNTTGELLYDADGAGAGAAVQIALLGAGLTLTNTDFLVG